jgi:hypothetical protein
MRKKQKEQPPTSLLCNPGITEGDTAEAKLQLCPWYLYIVLIQTLRIKLSFCPWSGLLWVLLNQLKLKLWYLPKICRVPRVPCFVVLASTFGHAVCVLDESKQLVYSEDLWHKRRPPTYITRPLLLTPVYPIVCSISRTEAPTFGIQCIGSNTIYSLWDHQPYLTGPSLYEPPPFGQLSHPVLGAKPNA